MYLSSAVRAAVLNKLHGFRKREGTACALCVCDMSGKNCLLSSLGTCLTNALNVKRLARDPKYKR